MTDTELRGAAERLRKFTEVAMRGTPSQAPAYRDAAWSEVYCGTPFTQNMDTAAVVASFLDLLPPADGGEHLSNGWLKSVGSDDDSPACVNGHYFSLPDGSQLFLWGYEGERVYSVTLVAHPELDREADDVSGEIEIGDLHTRGEFRRLADALGITLKEPK